MAITYGFYNAQYVEGTGYDRVYDAKDIGNMFNGIISDGVFANIGNALEVVPHTNNYTLTIKSGKAWFKGTWIENGTDYPIVTSVPPTVTGQYIYNAICVEIDRASRINRFAIVAGVASSDPQKPALTHSSTIDQYALAYIKIPANATKYDASMIENARGTAETPFITGLIDTINADNLYAQWAAQYQAFHAEFVQAMERAVSPTAIVPISLGGTGKTNASDSRDALAVSEKGYLDVDGTKYHMEVVSEVPTTFDPNTLYFVV